MIRNTLMFCLFGTLVINFARGGQGLRDPLQTHYGNSELDFINGCTTLEKQCLQNDDLALLSCVLNTTRSRSNKTQVSFHCQHKVWTREAELLDVSFLTRKLRPPCQNEPLIADCLNQSTENDLKLNSNEYAIDCILKKKSSVKGKDCWKMIDKIESLMFNDWQITVNFVKHCHDDIQTHSCGRIPPDPKSVSQTHTLKCLQSIQESLLHPECVLEISDLNKMMYSTLQLDKLVFAACKDDKNLFCPDELSPSWSMYKCLVNNKNDERMTKRCQNQLFYDQRNVVMNYRMSRGLVKACKDDIKKYHCRKGVVEDKDVRLAQILFCLENESRNNNTISQNCLREMSDHRRMLMNDYRLSPELMQECAKDITTLCKGVETGGRTIHCLMDHARPRRRKDKKITKECQKSLELLVQEANPGEDWRVDPVLRKACKDTVNDACREAMGKGGGNGNVMSCLMERLGTEVMRPECETALMQIQYFISRDFKLDPQLYLACKYDAVTQCKAKLHWADASEHRSEKDPLILPCLYNYAYSSELKGKLRPACEQQVRRVMRQRAVSVNLLPEIEDACIDDLANLCFDHTGKGEEILCLQSKIKDLSLKCKDVVTNFTETQSGHIELNPVININCRDAMERLCSAKLKRKIEEDDVMECLISHKNDPVIKADAKCRAAIEHEQLISLKNYRFTRKFKNACKSYVVRFCPNAQTKSQVVVCLSEIVRNDTISRRKPTIPRDCRQQLRSQLFQQKENIDLDPELKQACRNDLNIFCSNVPVGESAALECLQTAPQRLSDACRKAIFVVRKQEFTDNAIDYHLMTTCNDMIERFCHSKNIGTETSKILDCLKIHQQEPIFDENCKVVVVHRLIEQNMDYRLNNNLQISCNGDIKKYCSEIIASQPEDVELEGKVLKCLKDKFRASKLTSKCENEVVNVLKEQALNYRLNPLLAQLCKTEIKMLCADPNDSITNSDGRVEECLKEALLNRKILSTACAREVVQIIEQAEVDIEVDPLLERACTLDLLKYCKDLEHGAGRRLKCLKIILQDGDRQLEPECKKELSNRLQMYKYVASVVHDFGDVYDNIASSPFKKYFLVVFFSIVGLIFIFGLYCGRMTKRAMFIKKK